MKSYKPNYLSTITVFISCTFLACIPFIFVMILFIEKDLKEALLIIPLFIIMILIFVILFNIIHFIISIFTKKRVFIDDTEIKVSGKKILTQSILIDEVRYITIDLGIVTKYNGGTPASINLFNEDYTKYVNIDNPSFLMMINVLRRCKEAKISFKNNEMFGILSLIATLIVLLLGLFGAF